MQIINKQRFPTVNDTGIYGFFAEYRYLSNFHLAPVHLDGLVYPSSECAYMAQKTNDMDVRRQISEMKNPNDAKTFGRTIQLIDDWDNLRVPAMRKVLIAKFKNPELREKLKATGKLYLEETNNWQDKFWGACYGKGENNLGKLLMEVRNSFACKPKFDLFANYHKSKYHTSYIF